MARDRTLTIDTRIARMDQWIDRARDNGRLSYREARNAARQLNDIRREYRYRGGDGRISGRDEVHRQAVTRASDAKMAR